jgi:hypothetical protein
VFFGVCEPAVWLFHMRVSSIHSRIRQVANVGTFWRDGAETEIVPAKRPISIRDLLTHTTGISCGTQADVAAL